MNTAISQLEIIYEGEDLIAINKPPGLLVHRTKIAADAKEFALQSLRRAVGHRVYPVHRLDRKTSGVLLFARSKEANQYYQQQFRERKVRKNYIAVVRGYMHERGTINYDLKHEGKVRSAITHYDRIEQFELNIPSGKFNTSRYSLINVLPETGRFHQIRKHLAHIDHPVIGDRPHGCNKQNRIWKQKLGIPEMLLHARQVVLCDPNKEDIVISAPLSLPFRKALSILGLKSNLEDTKPGIILS